MCLSQLSTKSIHTCHVLCYVQIVPGFAVEELETFSALSIHLKIYLIKLDFDLLFLFCSSSCSCQHHQGKK